MQALLVLLAVAWTGAAPALLTAQVVVPDSFLDTIADDEPAPLPRDLAPAEAGLPLPSPHAPLRGGAPTGVVTTPSEYALNAGLLIRWGSFNSILTQMTVGITTGDPTAVVHILVTGPSQQASCTSVLSAAGADLDQVDFIPYTSDSVWIRDYGPRFVFEDGVQTVIDHTYNRPRPLDDAFSDFLCALWGVPQYDIPLVHGGGNFHLFDTGDAFMSSLILAENPTLTGPDVVDTYALYQGLGLTIYDGFPTWYDSTRHIDMWMLAVAGDAVIIGEYSPSDGEVHTITEDAVADLATRGYTVYRTPGWRSGGTHYTYTNAVILNDLLFVPEYTGYDAANAAALSTFGSAFPGKTLIPVNCSSIIPFAGAIHCIVMHVPASTARLKVTPAGTLAVSGPVGGPFTPATTVYTLLNDSDSPLDFAVACDVDWLTADPASGTIPAQASVEVSVQVTASADLLTAGVHAGRVDFTNLTDHDGDTHRDVELTAGDPIVAHAWNLDIDPGWARTGEWQFGVPLGLGGTTHGGPDPSAGATGANVFGTDLAGDYATTPGAPQTVTTDPIDCSNLVEVSLHYQRWLNTDYPPYVTVRVEVSAGAGWTTVWQNGPSEIADSSWLPMSHDISALADGAAALQVRWSLEVASGAWAYSGWNLDDIEIHGIPTGPCSAFLRGDVSGDASRDISDAILLLGHLFQGSPSVLACDDAADANDDGTLDIADALFALGVLFDGAGPFPPPSVSCGTDGTADGLDCLQPVACCP